MAEIKKIAPGGAAKVSPLKPRDKIHSFNFREFKDILDYIYADSLEDITVKAERKGAPFECKIKKDASQTMGLVFKNAEIVPVTCKNDCIFCFVKQLPKGLRESLYVKDDDYRLSFSMGNYVTLTGISKSEWQRILDYKLSPLYVSVHTTDHKLRCQMLGVKKAPDIVAQLKELTACGIKIHTQIVLVKGYNDKDNLRKTLQDLYLLGENILSVAIVPVGLTAFRENLPSLTPLGKEDARLAIDIAEEYYQKRKYFCFCSDEMYNIAQREMPGYEYYGDFGQIENGVGLRAKFLEEVRRAVEGKHINKKRNVGIVTSVSGAKDVKEACEIIGQHWQGLKYSIYPVENRFFGPSITVAGLLTYTDILAAFGNNLPENDFLVLPAVMFREFSDTFLDGKTIKDLRRALKTKIIVSGNEGEAFLDTLVYAR
jgi:putative radical SAM enzyme (TIGR03279 family)